MSEKLEDVKESLIIMSQANFNFNLIPIQLFKKIMNVCNEELIISVKSRIIKNFNRRMNLLFSTNLEPPD